MVFSLSLLSRERFAAERTSLPVHHRRVGLKRTAAEIKRAATNSARVTDVVTWHTAADKHPAFRRWRLKSQHDYRWSHWLIPPFESMEGAPTSNLHAFEFSRDLTRSRSRNALVARLRIHKNA